MADIPLDEGEENEVLRSAWIGFTLKLSQNVETSPNRALILWAVSSFEFHEGDPHYATRAYGVVMVGGERYYWSFDKMGAEKVLNVGELSESS